MKNYHNHLIIYINSVKENNAYKFIVLLIYGIILNKKG